MILRRKIKMEKKTFYLNDDEIKYLDEYKTIKKASSRNEALRIVIS